nr:serine carboxypeptidase II-2 [Tanacetum cinerariifolium]
SVLDVYHELIASGLRIWIFSGDTDAVIPVTSTRYSIDALNLTTISPWRAWYEDGQKWVLEAFSRPSDSLPPTSSIPPLRWNLVVVLLLGNGSSRVKFYLYRVKRVGGWTQKYEGLTFVTVRGAGHEVPLHKPQQALTLIKSFMAGTSMATSEQVIETITSSQQATGF